MSEEIKNDAVVNETAGVSKSKAKRDAIKAEVKAEKAKKKFDGILGWVIGIVIAVVVIGVIAMGIVQSVNTTTSSSDYSEGLTEEGYIEGAKLSGVKDLALESLVIPASEVEYTDEDVQSDIDSLLASAASYSDDASLTVALGDSINLDYAGTIDGVAFDGGTATGQTLEIGSGSFIDDFEDQLVGAHPGDSVTVEVTFPEDYSTTNTDLNGKDATFECVVNSIKVTPKYDDAFVLENYSEYASSAEEFTEYLRKTGYESNVKTYISTYISDNAEAKAVPSSYVKHLKAVAKYLDEQNYEYYNNYYYYYYGSQMYESFSDYTGMTDTEYESHLKESAKKLAALDMTYEAFYKNNGLTVSDEQYAEVVELYGGEDIVETYGSAYLHQVAIKYSVINYLADLVTIQ